MTILELKPATIGNQKGFILVATLWTLAMLSIAASFFALWTQRAVDIAQTRQMDIQGEIDILGTEANMVYFLTTQRFTIAGLTLPNLFLNNTKINNDDEVTILPIGNEIALDDRPYFGHGKAFFAIQDEGGLININFESKHTLGRLLGLLGVNINLHDPLIAKLKDYSDLDDSYRINGAESYHYKKRNLPPPTNRYLYHQMEIQRIIGWKEQSTLWENHQLKQLTHLWLAARPNLNTAPSLVLQAAYNINASSAKSIIEMRKIQPFYTSSMAHQITGEPLDLEPEEENIFPSSFLRLTLWYAGAQRMRQVYIQLKPNAEGRKPWQVEYRLEFELLPIYTEKLPDHAKTTLFNSTLSTKKQ